MVFISPMYILNTFPTAIDTWIYFWVAFFAPGGRGREAVSDSDTCHWMFFSYLEYLVGPQLERYG